MKKDQYVSKQFKLCFDKMFSRCMTLPGHELAEINEEVCTRFATSKCKYVKMDKIKKKRGFY